MLKTRYLLAIFVLALALPIALAACSSSSSSSSPTATEIGGDDTPTPFITVTPVGTTVPNENGTSPIFWRTADNFASVRVGQPYTVLFRIVNGYNEPQLSVGGSCASCPAADHQNEAVFVGTNSPPVGADAPGSYYPMNMTFPSAGYWVLVIQADADQVSIPVNVAP